MAGRELSGLQAVLEAGGPAIGGDEGERGVVAGIDVEGQVLDPALRGAADRLVDEPPPDAAALVAVDDLDRQLGAPRVLRVTLPAHDADRLVSGQLHPGGVAGAVDGRQRVERAAREPRHRRQEAQRP